MAETKVAVQVEGRTLQLSNLDKVLYPQVGFTKAQVIDYYTRIAPILLPHIQHRPTTLKRYPNGVEASFFYEKNCPSHRPPWVKTAAVWSGQNKRDMDYCLVEDLPTLIWLANLASLELHTSLSHAPKVDQPTMMVFDLDPGPPATIVECCRVALWLRDFFGELDLEIFPKTSGSKGLQVYLPINQKTSYEETKTFALAIAKELEKQHPDLTTSNMSKAERPGKVFIDWSQNDDHKTTISVYSLRARTRPTVSTPISWDEIDRCMKKKDPSVLVFDVDAVLKRVDKIGDLFAPVATLKHKLPKLPASVLPPPAGGT